MVDAVEEPALDGGVEVLAEDVTMAHHADGVRPHNVRLKGRSVCSPSAAPLRVDREPCVQRRAAADVAEVPSRLNVSGVVSEAE